MVRSKSKDPWLLYKSMPSALLAHVMHQILRCLWVNSEHNHSFQWTTSPRISPAQTSPELPFHMEHSLLYIFTWISHRHLTLYLPNSTLDILLQIYVSSILSLFNKCLINVTSASSILSSTFYQQPISYQVLLALTSKCLHLLPHVHPREAS